MIIVISKSVNVNIEEIKFSIKKHNNNASNVAQFMYRGFGVLNVLAGFASTMCSEIMLVGVSLIQHDLGFTSSSRRRSQCGVWSILLLSEMTR